MKKIFLASLLFSLLTGCSTISDETLALVNKTAPAARVSFLDGDYVSLRQYRGKTVVLMFWATWCSRSKTLITELSDYARTHKNPNTEFIAVSIDRFDRLSTLKNMIYLQGLDGVKHAFSGNDVRDEAYVSFRMIAIPTIVIIGPDGVVKGVDNDLDIVKEYVR